MDMNQISSGQRLLNVSAPVFKIRGLVRDAGEEAERPALTVMQLRRGHADCPCKILSNATSSANSLSAEGLVLPRLQREGVVASTFASSQTRDIGTPFVFARSKRRSKGCSVSMSLHTIGRAA